MAGAETQSDPSADYDRRAREILGHSRWWQIVVAALAMTVASPYQYVWSSIEGPLARDLGISLPALGAVFTLFVVFQAGSQFPVGWWRDRHGPRRLMLVAGVLAGGGYLALAYAASVWQLYLFYTAGAIGVGIVYTVAVNTALKWFPDRRGLTTGVGTMAFAAGGALFVPFVRAYATGTQYVLVLQVMGVIIGATIIVAAVVLRDPPESWYGIEAGVADGGEAAADDAARETASDTPESAGTDVPDDEPFTPREVLRTWQFWVMYVAFVGVSGAGLMLTAKIISFAEHFQLTAMTATLSAMALPVAGGVGRLVLGDLSDRVDRERAMAASFTLCGVGLGFVVLFARMGTSLGFIAAVVFATFFWSPQYTLFPSLVADYYGDYNSSSNYALVYSGKIWGGVFGGAVAGWIVVQTSWTTTFLLGGALAVLAGVAALSLHAPERERGSTAE